MKSTTAESCSIVLSQLFEMQYGLLTHSPLFSPDSSIRTPLSSSITLVSFLLAIQLVQHLVVIPISQLRADTCCIWLAQHVSNTHRTASTSRARASRAWLAWRWCFAVAFVSDGEDARRVVAVSGLWGCVARLSSRITIVIVAGRRMRLVAHG